MVNVDWVGGYKAKPNQTEFRRRKFDGATVTWQLFTFDEGLSWFWTIVGLKPIKMEGVSDVRPAPKEGQPAGYNDGATPNLA